jgi:hypothetical protein
MALIGAYQDDDHGLNSGSAYLYQVSTPIPTATPTNTATNTALPTFTATASATNSANRSSYLYPYPNQQRHANRTAHFYGKRHRKQSPNRNSDTIHDAHQHPPAICYGIEHTTCNQYGDKYRHANR